MPCRRCPRHWRWDRRAALHAGRAAAASASAPTFERGRVRARVGDGGRQILRRRRMRPARVQQACRRQQGRGAFPPGGSCRAGQQKGQRSRRDRSRVGRARIMWSPARSPIHQGWTNPGEQHARSARRAREAQSSTIEVHGSSLSSRRAFDPERMHRGFSPRAALALADLAQEIFH